MGKDHGGRRTLLNARFYQTGSLTPSSSPSEDLATAMASLLSSPWLRARPLPDFRPSFLFNLPSRRRHLSLTACLDDPASFEDLRKKVDGKVRVRFAPSPTGNLHVGGARTALFNYLFARFTLFFFLFSLVYNFVRWCD